MRGFNLESFKFGVYIVAPIVAVYIFGIPEVFVGVITNREYIKYTHEPIRPKTEEEIDRDAVDTTAEEVDDDTANRIAKYVEMGKATQSKQLDEFKQRIEGALRRDRV